MSRTKYVPHTNKYLLLALVPISLIFIIRGIFLTADYRNFIKNAEYTTGEIVDVSIYHSSKRRKKCNAEVEYTVDGKTYSFVIRNYDRGRHLYRNDYIGDSVSVMYNKTYHDKARSTREPYVESVLMIGGGITAAVMCFVLYKKNKGYDKIIENGITLDAVITRVENVNEFELNTYKFTKYTKYGRYRDEPEPLYVIVCQWENPVSGQVHEFRSIRLKEFLEPYVGRNITVYVDPNDYSKYFVDVNTILGQSFSTKAKPFNYSDFRKD